MEATGTSQPQVDSYGSLATCAAGIIDANQPAIVATARRGILRGIDDINMRGLFNFARKAASDTNLVDGQSTYSLPSDFFAADVLQLINTDGDVEHKLEHREWQRFNADYEKQDDTGRPKIWTSRSSFVDGNIIVYPEPDSSAATNWDLRLIYYRRIERPSGDEDIIVAPRELSHVLCLYGEYFVLERHDRNNEQKIQRKLAEYRGALGAFKGVDNREPDGRAQFRIAPDNEAVDTTLYIKVK